MKDKHSVYFYAPTMTDKQGASHTMSDQTHQLRLMQARLLSEHWRKQAETAETSVATLTARCAALERVLRRLGDDGMVMDAAYPIIASVLLGDEEFPTP